jgi:hypothetical protein
MVWHNTAGQIVGPVSVTYSGVEGGYAGTGNTDGAPAFLMPLLPRGVDGFFRTADDGYQLTGGSAGLDAGLASGAPPDDLTGASRPQGGGVDMGAYEFAGSPFFESGSVMTVR